MDIGIYRLENKVALVIAAGGGIGRAIARLYAAAGAKVACMDVVEERLQESCALIHAEGGEAIALLGDVTNESSLSSVVESVVQRFGRLDIVTNVVGGGGGGREKLNDMSSEYIEKIYKLNTLSIYTLLRLVIPHMQQVGGGAIVNISSLASAMVSPQMSVYGASKSAVNTLTAYAAYDLGKYGIRVNAIAPGAIRTPALESVLTPEIAAQMLKKTPLGRLGSAEDIANAALFLVSDASSWISGQTLFVSGGGTQELD